MVMESMFYEAFKIKQVVLVNSGVYCNTQVRIDQHTALLGDNNKGKTSLLNSLKLFLLPEENFHDCERKFAFKSSKGHYSKESTFGFYFPEKNSFIVLEAENPHGPFCIVLNMGTKLYSYERTGVPVPYSEIEHLFWDHSSPVNDGMGAPIKGLSISKVAEELKRLGGVVFKDVATIKERIYRHQPTRPDLGRYCLLPLRNGGKDNREIEAWKRLIHLAFDIGAKDRRTLPDTIATIIEGRKDRTEAELNVNFTEILARYASLRGVKDRLQKIRNGKPSWDHFDQHFTNLQVQSSDLMNLLCDVEQNINDQRAAHLEVRQACYTAHDILNRETSSLRESASASNRKSNELTGEMRQLKKNYEKSKKDSFDLSSAMQGYGSKSVEEILEILQEVIGEEKADIEALKDNEQFRREFEQLTRAINNDNTKVEHLEGLIAGVRPTLLDLIPGSSANILYSLNQQAFTGECPQLRAVDSETVSRFTALFDELNGTLTFLGKETPVIASQYDAGKLLQDRKDELVRVKERLRHQKRRQGELSKKTTMSVEQIEIAIAGKQRQLESIERNVTLLKRCEHIEEEFARLRQELDEVTAQLGILEAQCLEINNELSDAIGRLDMAKAALEEAKRHELSLTTWGGRVSDTLHARLEFLKGGYRQGERSEVVVTQKLMDNIERRTQEIAKRFNEAKELVSNLLDAVALDEDADFSHRSTLSLETLASLHEKYLLLYGRLDMEEINHRQQVIEHNDDTSIQMQSIRHARTLINGFIKEIEGHLSTIQVSNLDAVAIDCKLHPQFDELLTAVDSANMTGSDLPSQLMYDRLGSFCTQFFEADQRRGASLNMSRLIVSVDYRVRLKGSQEFTVEAQSTGTSVMINCRLLAFLLKELLQADTKVSLPLFIDELSTLDDKNLRSACDIADADGFYVFGATPSLTSGISKVLGNYMNLDYFNATEQAYHPNRTILYTGLSESLIALDRGVLIEQGKVKPAVTMDEEVQGD